MTIDYQIVFLGGMKTNEAITENEDGSFTIFVNNALCELKRFQAIRHALMHIGSDDFKKESVQEIESDAHKKHDCNVVM